MKKLLAAAFAAFLLFSPIQAAEFTDVGNNTILMEGTLNVDDEFAFADLYNSKSGTPDAFTHVILKNSPGGSFIDGVNIGANIFKFGLTTETEGFCNSSCAYIWLGGTTLYTHLGDEIGIHAPFYMEVPDGNFDKASTVATDPETMKANAAAEVLAGWYLGSVGISADATARFISTKQPDMTQINLLDVAFTILPEGEHGR